MPSPFLCTSSISRVLPRDSTNLGTSAPGPSLGNPVLARIAAEDFWIHLHGHWAGIRDPNFSVRSVEKDFGHSWHHLVSLHNVLQPLTSYSWVECLMSSFHITLCLALPVEGKRHLTENVLPISEVACYHIIQFSSSGWDSNCRYYFEPLSSFSLMFSDSSCSVWSHQTFLRFFCDFSE